MGIKRLKQTEFVHGEFYEVEGNVSPDRLTVDGETLESVRKFPYGKNQTALSISFRINDTVGNRKIIRYMDAVCFREKEFKSILKLKLKEDDPVSIFGRCSHKRDNNGFSIIVEESGWISIPSSI